MDAPQTKLKEKTLFDFIPNVYAPPESEEIFTKTVVSKFLQSLITNDLPNIIQYWNSYELDPNKDFLENMKDMYRCIMLNPMDLIIDVNFIKIFTRFDYLNIPLGILHQDTRMQLEIMQKNELLFFNGRYFRVFSTVLSKFKFVPEMVNSMLRQMIIKELCIDLFTCCKSRKVDVMNVLTILNIITQNVISKALSEAEVSVKSNNINPMVNIGDDKQGAIKIISDVLHTLNKPDQLKQALDSNISPRELLENVQISNKLITYSPNRKVNAITDSKKKMKLTFNQEPPKITELT